MNQPIYSACFTIVQMGDTLTLGGNYSIDDGENRTMRRIEKILDAETDAVDVQMWAQMVAARLCDAL